MFLSRNVTEKGFSDVHVLPNSKEYDSALCVSVHDVDFDGMNEILVGTYGQVSSREEINHQFQLLFIVFILLQCN